MKREQIIQELSAYNERKGIDCSYFKIGRTTVGVYRDVVCIADKDMYSTQPIESIQAIHFHPSHVCIGDTSIIY